MIVEQSERKFSAVLVFGLPFIYGGRNTDRYHRAVNLNHAISCFVDDDIVAKGAIELVHIQSSASEQLIVVRPAVQHIGTSTSDQTILVIAAQKGIVAGSAVQRVVLGFAFQLVVTVVALDVVPALSAFYRIGAATGKQTIGVVGMQQIRLRLFGSEGNPRLRRRQAALDNNSRLHVGENVVLVVESGRLTITCTVLPVSSVVATVAHVEIDDTGVHIAARAQVGIAEAVEPLVVRMRIEKAVRYPFCMQLCLNAFKDRQNACPRQCKWREISNAEKLPKVCARRRPRIGRHYNVALAG